jgi:hypothetical protein
LHQWRIANGVFDCLVSHSGRGVAAVDKPLIVAQ